MKRSLGIICSFLALTLVACGGHKSVAESTTTTSEGSSTTTTPVGAPPAIKITPIANMTSPTSVIQRQGDDADLFVTERAGTIRVIRNGFVDAKPILDISSDVTTDGERGLLSMAFSPTNTNVFYIDYTDTGGNVHVAEYTLDDKGVADPHSKRDLLQIDHSEQSNHNGGQLQFGPDGDLYIGVGDGGAGGDPNKNGQNLTVLLGKILRINPTQNGVAPYTVPYDNPFVKQAGAKPEIWAYGLRNPWRFSFDSNDGVDQGLWIGDVGQDHWEEVDHQPADPKGGENYGWSLREGTHKQDGEKPTDAVDPVYDYSHDKGACSITGGYVYRGKNVPDLFGRYIFGDYCSGQLMALTQKGSAWSESDLSTKVSGLESFGRGNNNEIYTVSLDGGIGRIDAA